jgi:hypothetical protein
VERRTLEGAVKYLMFAFLLLFSSASFAQSVCQLTIEKAEILAGINSLYLRAHSTNSPFLYRALQSGIAKAKAAGIDVPEMSQPGDEKTKAAHEENHAREDGDNAIGMPRHLPLAPLRMQGKGDAFYWSADFSTISEGIRGARGVHNVKTGVHYATSEIWQMSPHGTYVYNHGNGVFKMRETLTTDPIQSVELTDIDPTLSALTSVKAAVDDSGRYVMFLASSNIWHVAEFHAHTPSFSTTMQSLNQHGMTLVESVSFSDNSDFIFVRYRSPKSRLPQLGVWNTRDGKLVLDVETENEISPNISISATGGIVTVQDHTGTIFAWETQTGGLVADISIDPSSVSSVTAGPNDQFIYIGHYDNRIDVYDLSVGFSIGTIHTETSSKRLHFDSKTKVLSSNGFGIDWVVERWKLR